MSPDEDGRMLARLIAIGVDGLIGLLGAGVVILATDLTGVDLRVCLMASATVFFAAGLWRGSRPGLSPGLRSLLLALVPILLGIDLLVRAWPPGGATFSYIVLFPLVQWLSALTGLTLATREGGANATIFLTRTAKVAALSAVVALATMPSYSRFLATDTEVRPLPVIEFEAWDGERVQSADWSGKVVLLDFWASWCLPCVAELEEIEELRKLYAERDDVVFWAVNVQDEMEKAAKWTEDSGLSLPWARDPGDAAFTALEAKTIPALFLIDRTGRIRLTHVGYSASEGFGEHVGGFLETLVAEPAGSN